MAETSPAENVLGLSNKDLSLIRHSLEAGGKLIHQVINGLKHGTSEVQQLILQQSDVILECRVCRNLFRSLPNYLDHKRIYCQELFPNAGVSLLATPFAAEVPIIYPEPPDDAKEFVEMSNLISKFNKRNHLDPASPRKDKAQVPNIKTSIGRALEKACQKMKPQPLYLQRMKETKVAMQLVPVTSKNNNASKNRNRVVFAGGAETDLNNDTGITTCTTEYRSIGHTLCKMANFHNLQCLKCNRIYSSKKRLIYHIKKFHIKKYRKSEKCKINCDVGNQIQKRKVGRPRKSPPTEEFENKEIKEINLDGISTKSGKPSLKKFSHLAKKSNLKEYSEMKNGWCHICNHFYSGKRGLVFHMVRMHSGSRKIYPCLFCKVKFPSYASAVRHIQTLHKCKKSDMKHVVKKLKASGHVENQELQNMLQPEVKVEKCDSKMNALLQGNKVTSLPSSSSSSLDTKRSEPKEDDKNSKTSSQKYKFKCQICFQVFSGNRGLRYHMTRKHTNAQKIDHPYACHICFMAFFTSFSLKRHYRLKHNVQENIPNTERQVEAAHNKVETSACVLEKNILFYNNKKYRIPIKYYKAVSKFADFPSHCLTCKQNYAGVRNLISHIIKEHCTYKNAFPCPFCHLSFISSVSILRHTKVKHSCSDQEIADLSRKLQVWEQQKKRSLDLKVRKPVNNISDSTNEVQQNAEDPASPPPPSPPPRPQKISIPLHPKGTSIHEVTDFKTGMCLRCDRKFLGLPGLMTHMSRMHSYLFNKKHKCSECSESFGSVLAIIKHMESAHGVSYEQNPTALKPNRLLDDRSAGPSSSLDEAQPEKEQETLDSCKKKMNEEDAQNSELVRQCADFLKSRCLKCNEEFAGNRGLIAHIYRAHADRGQTYSCYICLKTFASYALASQHTRNSHNYQGSAMMYVRVNSTIKGDKCAEK